MGIKSVIQKLSYKDSLGDIPVNAQGQEVPALLFANSKNTVKWGDIYLFTNFGISGGDTVTISSDITTHYIEDNSAIQDHWAIQPINYTLTGYVGEVIYQPAEKLTNWLESNVTNYLEPLSIISPTVSSYMSTAMNTVHQIEANYQKYSKYAENLIKSFNAMQGITTEPSNQYTVCQNLIKLRNNRILVDVFTPFGTFKNMAIANAVMTQDEKSKYKSSLQVSLQEYRQVSTITRQATENEVSKLVGSQQEAEINTGNAKGENIGNNSVLYNTLTKGQAYKNF